MDRFRGAALCVLHSVSDPAGSLTRGRAPHVLGMCPGRTGTATAQRGARRNRRNFDGGRSWLRLTRLALLAQRASAKNHAFISAFSRWLML